MMIDMKDTRGFTLLELLIVIAIIGLLSAVVLMSLDESRERGRDANRASQVQEFIKAAELYFTDNGVYPDDGVADNTYNYMSAPGVDGFVSDEGGYLSRIPDDPLYSDVNEGYQYCSSSDGDSFTILVHAESGNGDFCYVSRGPDTPSSYCGAFLDTISDCSDRF